MPTPGEPRTNLKLPIVARFRPSRKTRWFWTTNFHMRHAYPILDAWGFHKTPTILTWAKDRMDNGYWLRGQTEHCILAVRGNPTTTPGEKLTGAAND